MKKIAIIFILSIFHFLLYSQNDTVNFHKEELDVFLKDSSNNEIYYKKKHIPHVLKKSIKEYFNYHFYIANPKKRFNETDRIYNPFLPSKQLLFLIKNQNKYALIYKQGGRGLHTVCIFAEINSKKNVNIKVYYLTYKITTVSEFLEYIVFQKKFIVKKKKQK
jgi:hypothetical protein